MISRFLANLRLAYTNPQEEKEYRDYKTVLNTGFYTNLFIGITLLCIIVIVRFFLIGMKVESYLAIAMGVFGVLILLLRRRLQKYIQFISLIYICFMAANVLQLVPKILAHFTMTDAFCFGYYFALVTKLVDFRVNNFYVALVLHAMFITARWVMVHPVYPEQAVLIFFMEILPIFLSFKAEKAERSIFDMKYKSRDLLLKFKQLLTELLPNPLAVLSLDSSKALFTNDAFKNISEKDESFNFDEILDSLVVDSQNNEENRSLFQKLRQFTYNQVDIEWLRLSSLMHLLHKNKSIFQEYPVISFQLTKETVKTEESPRKGKEEHRNEHLMKSMQVPVLDFSKQFSNPEQCYMLERSNSDFNKKDVYITPNTPLMSPKENLCNKPEQSPTSENKGTPFTSDPQNRIFKVKMFPLTWDEQEAIAIVFDDVTYERTIMELKIADKNKDLVIAMVSHELRTPINGMLGMLEMIKKKIPQQADVALYLNACKTSSKLLLNLVNSILDSSQIKHNKLTLGYSRFCLTELLSEIKSLFNHFCFLKNLFIEIQIESDVPKEIITDPTRLSQIIINLVGNAFKFTFKGGVTIKVSLNKDDQNRLKFSVVDTGIGIKKEDQQKLFKVFGKLEQQDRKINTQGVGLGLTISNDLVQLLDSNEKKGINVESEVGKGTTFSFCIQLERKDKLDEIIVGKSDNEESYIEGIDEIQSSHTVLDKVTTHTEVANKRALFLSQQSRNTILQDVSFRNETQIRYSQFSTLRQNDCSEIRQSDFASKRGSCKDHCCLIVDDNPFNLMVATNLMQEKGFRVKSALTGQEAIDTVKDHNNNRGPIRVILMDCQMPVMDGYEASRILTKMMRDGEVERCPIIALTANNKDEEHDKLCKDAGMSGCVQKPINVKDLDEMLRNLVKRKEPGV